MNDKSTLETDKLYNPENGWTGVVPISYARKLEIERNQLRAWVKEAAPMLSTAACIVVDAAVERLSEIEGCRALLEICPLDKTEWKEARKS